MDTRVKEIQQKLNSLPQSLDEQPEQGQKAKIRTLQQCLQKVQGRCEEENIVWEHKVTSMFDYLRKLEHSLKETNNEIEIEGIIQTIKKTR